MGCPYKTSLHIAHYTINIQGTHKGCPYGVVETFLANNVYQQLQFCFAYSSCNEGFFVLHYVLCDFVCVTANFLGFVVVFYCLLVVLCYPFYMCGIDNTRFL